MEIIQLFLKFLIKFLSEIPIFSFIFIKMFKRSQLIFNSTLIEFLETMEIFFKMLIKFYNRIQLFLFKKNTISLRK